MPTLNINGNIRVDTVANWTADATVYSAKTILVSSDALYGATDQRKFKIADGNQTWAQLDYFPVSGYDDATSSTQTQLNGKQPLDSDLTSIAGLSPSNDDIIQRKAGVWTNRTIAQLLSDLGLGSIYQPLDSDLTTIAGLTATTDNFIQSKSGAWASRTPAQVGVDLRNRALFKMNTANSHTGDTNETVLYTTPTAVLSTANISALDIVRIMFSGGATSNGNTKTIRLYANTTADLTGTPILLGTIAFTTGNNSSSGFIRHINFVSLTQQLMFPQSTSLWSDAGSGTSGTSTDPAMNVSGNSYYLVLSVQLGVNTDTVRINWGYAEIFR